MNIKEEYPEIPSLLLYAMVGVVGMSKTWEIIQCYDEAKEESEGDEEEGEEEE